MLLFAIRPPMATISIKCRPTIKYRQMNGSRLCTVNITVLLCMTLEIVSDWIHHFQSKQFIGSISFAFHVHSLRTIEKPEHLKSTFTFVRAIRIYQPQYFLNFKTEKVLCVESISNLILQFGSSWIFFFPALFRLVCFFSSLIHLYVTHRLFADPVFVLDSFEVRK